MSSESATTLVRKAPVTHTGGGTRFLIITDHTDLGRSLEHHLNTIWEDSECRVFSPQVSGRLHPAFCAAAFDAILLDDRVERGRGIEWLRNLRHRESIPPIIYLARADEEATHRRAVEFGAADSLVRDRIEHRRLASVLRDEVARRRQEMALWRARPETEALCRFGDVTIRGQRFVRELAVGSNSRLYLAESEKAGEMVVLKVLSDSPQTEQHSQFTRFLQEYELIFLIRHPNVVRIFDLGIADDHAYIAMEYFPLGDLRTKLTRAMKPAEALNYLHQMAGALQAVHEVGVLHRDLKPGNVMIRADGTLAIIDFGIAKQMQSKGDITGTGEIFGTPYYMSPEQGHGQAVDARSDLYSLGIILYEMLTHRKPYLAASPMNVIYMHGNAPIPTLTGPAEICQPLINRLMAKSPDDRFASANELLAEIERMPGE
jgi:eukaryotic-like serine/threonine-protein kinase